MRKNQIARLAVAALATATALHAQDLVQDALAGFPRQTIRLEYSSPAKLRALANYASLRQRYLGARLQSLENSFAKLGVRENDVDELLLGWQVSQADMALYGFATGRFRAKAMRQNAADRGLEPTPIAGQPGYCLEAGLAATCVILLSESRGVFGSLGVLTSLMEARAGQAPGLGSDEHFTSLVKEAARSDAPIWGVAVGAAVGDWFKGWMPGQQNLQLDWSKTFGAVEALAYSVQVKDKAELSVRLDCASPEAAGNLRQVLEGLRLFQQMAWQNQNPDRSNPFQALELTGRDRRLDLSLSAALDALGGAP